MIDLQSVWFVLLGVLFTGFFVLEGFDYGVGILLPFLGKNDEERRVIINSIGPFWDANEVWLITAGGAMFAAFPGAYATLFSGLYLALVLMLAALIVRGVAFEFRGKIQSATWKSVWDWAIFVGSAVPALLWGVAFANLMRGLPIDSTMNYSGTFLDLLNPFALLGGVATVAMFTLHGANFLLLKTTGKVNDRAYGAAMWVGAVATALCFAFVVSSYFATDIFGSLGVDPGIIPLAAGVTLVSIRFFVKARRPGLAFVAGTLTIALSSFTLFLGLYPRILISSLDPGWSLTVYNASSSSYTLTTMLVVALIFTPLVLIYQGWSYWVFRKRVTPDSLEY